MSRATRAFIAAACLAASIPFSGAVLAQDESAAPLTLFSTDANGMPTMEPYPTTKAYAIGVSQIGNNFPFVVAMVEGSDKAAVDMGFKQILTDAQFDVQQQVDQMEDIISQAPDGIVLVALDAEAVIPPLEAATAAGIPVLTCWNDLGGPPRENYPGSISLIGVDEVQTGRDVAQLAIDLLPEGGKVAIIEGAPGFQASIERSEGFTEVLAANPAIEIVASQPGNWVREDALAVAENLIQANPDLDLIYTHDDNMAIGAITALRDAGKLDQVDVVGVGGSIEALDAVRAGDLYGTVFDSPRAAAYICSKALVAYLEGATLPSEVFLPRPIVTAANVDSFSGEW